MMTKPAKSQLIKELEVHLQPDDYNYSHCSNASFIMDVMATIRKVNLTRLTRFNEFLASFASFSDAYHQFGRCDFVFDMYSEEPSVKDSERKRRNTTVPIEYSSINPSSPLPKDMATFWPSNNNKLLEKMIYNHLRSSISPTGEYPTILGQVTREEEEWQCISICNGKENTLSHLQSTFEEADLRIPLHVLDSLKNGHRVCVVISNDTDVIVALLYHMPLFLQHNLKELWVRAGVGDTTRYVPLHILFERLGCHLCAVLPAIHSLTGCDITSKIGTKKAALKAEPEELLKHFGRSPTLSPPIIRNAECYLVKVLKSTSDAKNFSDLRAEVFHHTKGSSHHNLPPSSQGLLPHIKRSFYTAYNIMHALEYHQDPENVSSLKPEDFGYKHDKNQLIPETSWKILESHWTVVCSCTKCAMSTCPCRTATVKCVNFCQCQKASPSTCKNPIA